MMICRMFIIVLVIFLILLNGCNEEKQCELQVRMAFNNQEFSGIVVDSYFDTNDRGSPKIVLDNHSDVVGTYAHMLCRYLTRGDSIWKFRGSLKYYVKREGEISVFYPDCGKIQIRDTGVFFMESYLNDCDKDKQTKKFPIHLN